MKTISLLDQESQESPFKIISI